MAELDLAAQLENSMASAPAIAMNYFMKLHQTNSQDPKLQGQMTYGPNFVPVTPEDQWVVMMDKMQHGYLERQGGDVGREQYVSIFEPVPQMTQLPEAKAGYQFHYAMVMHLAADRQPSFAVEYGGDQQGFIEMVNNSVLAAVRARLQDAEAVKEQSYHPVVRFGVTSYTSRNGLKYKPVCEIVGWTGPVALLDAPSETDTPETSETPQVEHQPEPQVDRPTEPPVNRSIPHSGAAQAEPRASNGDLLGDATETPEAAETAPVAPESGDNPPPPAVPRQPKARTRVRLTE